jgi:Tfp pilus assembly protein PilN
MMKNSQRQAMMYIGLGALIAIVILIAMGRLRIERYEEPVSDTQLENLLSELAQDAPMEDETEMTATGPSMDYDSDSE